MAPRPDVPRPLQLAAAVAAVQGGVLVVLAVTEMVNLSGDRLGVALSVSAFFALCALGLLVAARGLLRAEAWARGPVLLTQLILLGVAWQSRSESPVALTVLIVVVAVLGLVGMVHPATSERLSRP